MDIKELWDNVLTEIESFVSKANFATWFKDTKSLVLKIVIYLSVPNTLFKNGF